MRVPSNDIPRPINLSGDWETPLPPAQAILGAMTDPVGAYLLSTNSPEGLGALLLEDSVDLLKTVMAVGATQVGVPSQLLPAFEGVVTAAIDRDWSALATSAAGSGLDIAMNALGAIPILGWLAKGALVVVRGMIQVSKDKRAPPEMVPLAVYDRAVNNWYASRALHVIGDAGAYDRDWTPLFDVPGTGPWVGLRGDPHGYLFHLQGYDDQAQRETTESLGAGKAMVPGAGLGLVQVNVNFPESIDMNRAEIPYAAYFAATRAYDKTETLPSYLRVGVAAWQTMQARTPAMFQVNVGGLVQRWRAYVEGGLDVADAFRNSSAKNRDVRGRKRNAGYLAHTMFYDVDLLQQYGSPLWLPEGEPARDMRNPLWGQYGYEDRIQLPISRRLDQIAAEKLISLYKRQNAALDTLMVAYCSEKQPAFQAESLQRKLQARRRELLRHPAVADVNLDDVLDKDYRSLLYTAKFSPGFGFTAAPGTGGRVARPFGDIDQIPEGSPWDVLGPAKGPAQILGKGLLIGGALYGGYKLYKWLGSR